MSIACRLGRSPSPRHNQRRTCRRHEALKRDRMRKWIARAYSHPRAFDGAICVFIFTLVLPTAAALLKEVARYQFVRLIAEGHHVMVLIARRF